MCIKQVRIIRRSLKCYAVTTPNQKCVAMLLSLFSWDADCLWHILNYDSATDIRVGFKTVENSVKISRGKPIISLWILNFSLVNLLLALSYVLACIVLLSNHMPLLLNVVFEEPNFKSTISFLQSNKNEWYHDMKTGRHVKYAERAALGF